MRTLLSVLTILLISISALCAPPQLAELTASGVTIPDMTKMSVRVKIHESYIKKVKKGEKARVTIDAFPDEKLDGEVTKVGVLPDSQNRWMNQDLKVYLTTITINGSSDWIKPGMSAKVEALSSARGQEAALRQTYGVALPGEGEIQIIEEAPSSTPPQTVPQNIFARLWHAIFP